MASRPLLFLDVDGPLNPYAPSNSAGYVVRRLNGAQVRLHRSHGSRLQALPYTLVWATSWEEDANLWIAPELRLPRLPVVTFPDQGVQPAGLSFKTTTLLECAAGRPFAWVDDEITDHDRQWVADHHPGPALLHQVDPAAGLTDADFHALAQWAQTSAPTAART